jgi:uncharacterized protein YcaQ
MKLTLGKDEVRKLALHAQFPGNRTGTAFTVDDAAETITHLGYVQIDTISVVERAHHHVLWSRLHDYQRGSITKLQEPPRRIFEYWSHAAAYLPLKDYRFCLPRIVRLRENGFQWYPRVEKDVSLALEIIKKEGPKQARDFKTTDGKKRGQWWDLKPMKIALEHLFQEGRLMVTTRKNFQKVYDLPERVLTPEINTGMPTDEEMAAYLIDNSLRSLGVASEKDFGYQRKDGTKAISWVLKEKIKNNEIAVLTIDGVKRLYYVHCSLLEEYRRQDPPPASMVRLLSPFDNQAIIRQRLKDLFDFDYQIECYVPKEKRKLGYFSLPVLYNHQFIGILDPKADRKEKNLIINHLYISNMPEDTNEFLHHLVTEIHAYKQFNRCAAIRVDKVFPKGFKRRLSAALKQKKK